MHILKKRFYKHYSENAAIRYTVLQCSVTIYANHHLHRDADKSLAFHIFLFAAQPKEFFLDELEKLEQRCHKCVELEGNI
jgi:hypothetical protein